MAKKAPKKNRRLQRKHKPGNAGENTIQGMTGVAWYTPETYEHLLAVSTDRPARHDTYAEWLTSATQALDGLKALGLPMVKVQIDVNELVNWCREHGYPVDGTACSKFVSHKLSSGEAVIVP